MPLGVHIPSSVYLAFGPSANLVGSALTVGNLVGTKLGALVGDRLGAKVGDDVGAGGAGAAMVVAKKKRKLQ